MKPRPPPSAGFFTPSSTAVAPPPAETLLPSSSSSSSSSSFFSSSSESHSLSSQTSLDSNLSLQTFPSLPSLQTLSPHSPPLSNLSHALLASLHPTPRLPINSLAVSGDNNLLYAASGHEISVYDHRNSYALLDSFNNEDPSTGSVKSIVAFTGGKILTAHQDSKIRIWKSTASNQNQHRHKLQTTLPRVPDRLRRFLLPKNYTTVRRHKRRLWIEHSDAVSDVAVSGDSIFSVSWDRTLKIWGKSNLRCLESVRAHDDAINAVTVSGGGEVYTGCADGRIRVWAVECGSKRYALVATLEKHKSAVNALALNGDGSVLFSGSCDRSILVWGREDSGNHMAVVGVLRGHRKAVLCLINVRDLLMSGSEDRTVRIWKRGGSGGRYDCLVVLEGHEKPVKSIAAAPATDEDDGGPGERVTVFTGSLDGEVKVWRVICGNSNSF